MRLFPIEVKEIFHSYMVHDCTAIAAGFGESEMKKMINRAILENLRFFVIFIFEEKRNKCKFL